MWGKELSAGRWGGAGRRQLWFKGARAGILVVLRFSMLTLVGDTGVYTGDQIVRA